jgi:ankyrin repeat protein
MSLLSLPTELLQLTLEHLDRQSDINALVQTCHHLYDNLNGALYRRNVKLFNRSALLWAARFGHEGTAAKSLKEEPFFEIHDENGLTPLLLAINSNSESIFRQLLMLTGLNLEAKGWIRRTPLATAAWHGRQKMVKLLLEKGADLERRDQDCQTPLMLAAVNGHEEVVKLLLNNGASLECKDKLGQTAISWAAEHGHAKTVELLLAKGAVPNSSDNYGRTPLSFAAENGHDTVAKLLLEAGADPDSKAMNGNTPLIYAAMFTRGALAVIRLLLEAGSDPTIMNNGGLTAVLVASTDWGTKDPDILVVNLLLEETTRWMRVRAAYYNCGW